MAKNKPYKIPNRIARCVLTDLSAIFFIVILGIIFGLILHTPIVVPVLSLLVAELLLIAHPISTLNHENHQKSSRHHRYVRLEIIKFGLWAAVCVQLSFFTFFWYHALSPSYVDTSNPLFIHASTIALVVFVICQNLNILLVRADDHKRVGTNHLWSNHRLLVAYGVSFFILLNLIYNPLLQPILNTAPIGLVEWVVVIFGVSIYIGGRRLQRYTRLHTRQVLIKLHLEDNHKRIVK